MSGGLSRDDRSARSRRFKVVATMIAVAVHAARSEGRTDVPDGHLNPYRACGLNGLFVVAAMKGIPVSRAALEREMKPRENGDTSIADIERAATGLGLDPVSARLDLASVGDAPLPAIVQLRSPAPESSASHYVVLLAWHKRGVLTLDPPNGATLHPYDEFARDWTGILMAFPSDQRERDAFQARLAGLRGTPTGARWLLVGAIAPLAWVLFASRRRRGPSPPIDQHA